MASRTSKYARYLTKPLLELVEEQALNGTIEEQLDLSEELALMRDIAGRAAAMYGIACEHGKPEQIFSAAEVMRDALDQVRKFVDSMVKMRKDTSIDPLVLTTLISQVERCIWTVCGVEHMHLAKDIAAELQRTVTLTKEAEGTELLPTDTVVAIMDSTIPDVA